MFKPNKLLKFIKYNSYKRLYGKHRIIRTKWKPILLTSLGCSVGGYYFYKWKQESDGNKEIIKEYNEKINNIEETVKIQIKEGFISKNNKGIIYYFNFVFRVIVLFVKFIPIAVIYPFINMSISLNNYYYYLLVKTFISAGPTFIKLGQWIATRPDLFSPKLIRSMEILHHSTYAHSFNDTKKIIKDAFGKDLDDLFDDFSREPIASGSIAQIYKAQYKGNNVAVKVRHPNIDRIISLDMEIMRVLSKPLSFFIKSFDFFNIDELLKNLSVNMEMQLNLTIEASNLQRFNKNFKDVKYINFPQLVDNLYHPLALVETFEEGFNIQDYFRNRKNSNVDKNIKEKVIKLGIIMYLKMVIDNFMHADLHPGNMLMKINDDNVSLTLLDVGLVSTLNKKDKDIIYNLFKYTLTNQPKQVANYLINEEQKNKLTFETMKNFTQEIKIICDYLGDKTTDKIQITETFNNVLDIFKKYDLKINPCISTFLLGTTIMEGWARQLNPDFDFLDEAIDAFTSNITLSKEYFKQKMQ